MKAKEKARQIAKIVAVTVLVIIALFGIGFAVLYIKEDRREKPVVQDETRIAVVNELEETAADIGMQEQKPVFFDSTRDACLE